MGEGVCLLGGVRLLGRSASGWRPRPVNMQAGVKTLPLPMVGKYLFSRYFEVQSSLELKAQPRAPLPAVSVQCNYSSNFSKIGNFICKEIKLFFYCLHLKCISKSLQNNYQGWEGWPHAHLNASYKSINIC